MCALKNDKKVPIGGSLELKLVADENFGPPSCLGVAKTFAVDVEDPQGWDKERGGASRLNHLQLQRGSSRSTTMGQDPILLQSRARADVKQRWHQQHWWLPNAKDWEGLLTNCQDTIW